MGPGLHPQYTRAQFNWGGCGWPKQLHEPERSTDKCGTQRRRTRKASMKTEPNDVQEPNDEEEGAQLPQTPLLFCLDTPPFLLGHLPSCLDTSLLVWTPPFLFGHLPSCLDTPFLLGHLPFFWTPLFVWTSPFFLFGHPPFFLFGHPPFFLFRHFPFFCLDTPF